MPVKCEMNVICKTFVFEFKYVNQSKQGEICASACKKWMMVHLKLSKVYSSLKCIIKKHKPDFKFL